MEREKKNQHRNHLIEAKRVEKYQRDLLRWEYMEEESKRQEERLKVSKQKYGAGKRNKGGAAYNIVSLGYENSEEGQVLKSRDDQSHFRHLLRSKAIDTRANCGYNLVTGQLRPGIQLPAYSHIAASGANIMSQRSAS